MAGTRLVAHQLDSLRDVRKQRATTDAHSTGSIFIEAAREWSTDRAVRLGASLAYYSLFALIPTLALAVSLASLFFGQEEVSRQLYTSMAEVLGNDVARLIVDAIDRVDDDSIIGLLPIVSLGVLLFSATLLFVAWREVVDIIWGLPKQTGLGASLRRRGFAVAAVLGGGVVLTVVMFVQTLIGSVSDWFDLDLIGVLATAASSVISTAIGVLVLAVLFKYSPGIDLGWRSVPLAAALTMILLAIGAHAYGIYVERFGLNSATGVAGTVFLGLVFVYYAAQILLYGVEVVKVAHRRSTGEPDRVTAG
jgi:membrane protein